MFNRFIALFVLVIVAGVALPAKAQKSGFTLYGEPSSGAKAVTDEQRFVHPLTSPYYNEDPFVGTDVRLWYVYHKFPSSGTIGGGDAQVFALQLRVAITDQLQLVAYKDGFMILDSGIVQEDGWNNVAAGLKWNFYQDYQQQLYLAAGVGFEFPWGESKVLQNDSTFRAWFSAAKGFDRFHLGGAVNFYVPVKGKNEGLGSSTSWSWHIHADYYVNEYFSPVVELNGYHILDRGTVAVPFSGIDVANLGGGSDNISMGIGAEFRVPNWIENLAIRGAFEFPLTNETESLYGWRFTFSVVYSF